jgi:hypothetical protein
MMNGAVRARRCDTPSAKQPGVCYEDQCFVYDRDGVNVKSVSRSPGNNIYVQWLNSLVSKPHNGLQMPVQQTSCV